LPYAVQIASKGWQAAMRDNKEIELGANVIAGEVTYRAVADAFDLPYTPISNFL
jgi:alanine dehydrogenase